MEGRMEGRMDRKAGRLEGKMDYEKIYRLKDIQWYYRSMFSISLRLSPMINAWSSTLSAKASSFSFSS
jgi:hypothetical protein